MADIWGVLSAGGVRVNDYFVLVSETESGHRITVQRRGYDDKIIDIPDTDMADATTAANEAAEAANGAAGAANDAAELANTAAQNVNTAAQKAFNLDSNDASAIDDNTDLNSLTTTGNYKVTTSAHAATMTNAPTTSVPYRLIVMRTSATDKLFQIAFMNTGGSTTTKIAYRSKPGDSWTAWKRVASTDDITSALNDYDTTIKGYVDNSISDYNSGVTNRTQNLFDKKNANILNAYVARNSDTITSNAKTKSLYIPCKANTKYTVCRKSGAYTTLAATTAEEPDVGDECVYLSKPNADITINGHTYSRFETGATAAWLVLYYYNGNHDAEGTDTSYFDSIMIYEGWDFLQYRSYYAVDVPYRERSPINTYGIFGIRFRRNEKIPAVMRIYDAEGMQYGQQTGSNIAYSDFDKAFPWCEMRECNVSVDSNGEKTITYSGESGFSRNNDTFIEIPAFYFKRTVINGVEVWCVSGRPFSGAEFEPWFLNGDGSIAQYRYIGKYEGAPTSGGHVSVTGVAPDTSQGLSAYKTHCASLNFELMSVEAHCAISHLMAIEYGTLDSQAINVGISYYPYSMSSATWNKPQNTGETTNTATLLYRAELENVKVGDTVYVSHASAQDTSDPRTVTAIAFDGTSTVDITFDGSAYEMISGSTYVFPAKQPTGALDALSYVNGRTNADSLHGPFAYRGIENPYGNAWEYVDGIKWSYSTQKYTLGESSPAFAAPYQPDTGSDTATEGWIKTLGYDRKMPWAILPATVGGTISTYIPDEWNTTSSGDNQVCVIGGGWDHQSENGMFAMRTGAALSNWLYGYRAMV